MFEYIVKGLVDCLVLIALAAFGAGAIVGSIATYLITH